ncbi:ATP-binding protein [Brevibacillus choshinensis]|uniref:histidine kinase n=1 Tax=Brevibacillus choshinensis TaxID=54911 RepID=A0ABX7FSW9_BRECH|nr:ATP-binding protein [Brevibacillus choshinensis]QRG68828.1 response regulator [Brevibacillus choshinensis]
MANRGKLLTIFTLFFLFIGIRLAWDLFYQPSIMPTAKQGVLDASGWDFARNGSIKLNGEWEFYRGKLHTGDRLRAEETPLMVQVPGVWDKYVSDQKKTSLGSGTYHLKVLLPDSEQRIWGIRVSNIRSSHLLLINGQTVGQQGQPSVQSDDVIARNVPYLSFANVTGNEAEIVLQVANFDFAAGGGVFGAITFGPIQEALASKRSSEYFDATAGSVLFLFSIYFFLLYAYNRRFKEFIYFSLSNLFAALYLVTNRERVALDWLDLSYDWATRIQFLSMLALAFTYSLFMKNIVLRASKETISRVLLSIILLCAISVLLLEARQFTHLQGVYIFFSWITVMYHFVRLLRRVWHNPSSVRWVVISTCSLLFNGVFENLRALGWVHDDGWIPVEIIVFALALAMLSTRGYFTALQKAEQLTERLLVLDKTKDEFLANTSHELRTPLHATLSIVQSVVDGGAGELTDRQKAELELVLGVGKRLTHLLDDLLDISHLQAGMELKLTSLNVHDVVAVALDVMRHMTDESSVRLASKVPKQMVPIEADEQRFLQIIFNLLYNAIKFTPEGTITVEAEQKGRMVEIRVADTGIGIAEERQARIFAMFEQGDHRNRQEGKGLGLHICQKLVERHGGQIQVSSAVGQGTTFSFTMPVSDHRGDTSYKENTEQYVIRSVERMTAAASETRPLSFDPKPFSEKKEAAILLVDDEPTNQYVMMRLLASEPYQIVTASDGREALEALTKQRNWDLVILDVMLPDQSGYDVCQRLRDMYSSSELPVLMVTARGQKDDLLAGFAAGANDYITKPVEALELRARVRTLLQMKQSVSHLIEAEMAFLRSQIKPHFLFNALSTILAVSHQDMETAQELLLDFSTYLRHSFDFEQQENVIPLQSELELVEAYLHIEQIRFGERLEVNYEVEENLTGCIPPLTIQPIVENAIRHGAMSRLSEGTVTLLVYTENDDTVIKVEDNGRGFAAREVAEQKTRNGVGLRNIKRRLRNFGGKLEIVSKPDEGTLVTIRIPRSQPAND